MAQTLNTVKPKSFADLIDIVETFQASSVTSWYRGCSNASYLLRPTLYRHKKRTKIADIAVLEKELTTRFVQRSMPFLTRSLTDEWDKLFLMQHYGVPTRLLDWSENPFVSIYFALVSESNSTSVDAALWMCDPVAWNRAALDHLSFKGGILDQSDTALNGYAPGTPVDGMPIVPIMVYGAYNSPRIVAQRGGFAIFGQGIESMEKYYEQAKFPDGILSKVIIEHQYIEALRKSLFRKGFTESVVFPDLDGLSREIKRTFEF